MAGIYDIAAGLKTPGDLRAISLANENRRLQNRILEQSAKYFDETGGSEAKQKDTELSIRASEASTSAGNLRARLQEFGLNLEKNQRERVENFYEQVGIVHRAIQSGVPLPQAEELYHSILEANKVGDAFKGTPLERFDPDIIEAIGTMGQSEDPKMPVTMVRMNNGKLETQAMDRNDLSNIIRMTQDGWMADPNGSLLRGLAEGGNLDLLNNLQGRGPDQSQYMNVYRQLSAAAGSVERMFELLDNTPNMNAGTGTVGRWVRGFESALSQVSGLAQLVTGITPPQPGDAPIPSQAPQEYADTIQQFAEQIERGPLKNLVGDSARFAVNVNDLIYARAKINDPEGRLSIDDVKAQARLFDVGSVEQLKAVLDETLLSLERNARVYQAIMDPEGALAKATGVDLTNAFSGRRGRSTGGRATQQDAQGEIIQRLEDGTVIRRRRIN